VCVCVCVSVQAAFPPAYQPDQAKFHFSLADFPVWPSLVIDVSVSGGLLVGLLVLLFDMQMIFNCVVAPSC